MAAVQETVRPTTGTPPWWRRGPVVAGVVVLILGVELILGWHALAGALRQLRAPHWGWVAGALAAELASMGTYARMQRALLRGAGTKVSVRKHVATAYAAHSLSSTLPGGPVFSTTFSFQQMRRFGASPAVASWCVALSGVLSTSALIVIGAAGGLLGTRAAGTRWSSTRWRPWSSPSAYGCWPSTRIGWTSRCGAWSAGSTGYAGGRPGTARTRC